MHALLPIILALVAGQAPAAVGPMLGALSLNQWASIASTAINDAPDIIKALVAMPTPADAQAALTQLGDAAVDGAVRKSLMDWLAANGQAAMYIQDLSIQNQR